MQHISRVGVARTFQEVRTFATLSVRENVLLSERPPRTPECLGPTDQTSVAHGSIPSAVSSDVAMELVGISQLAEQPSRQLSFGQRKLLNIACCLSANPEVYLLDEPLGGLDLRMAETVCNLLQCLKSLGRIVVFVEHDLESVRSIADRLVVLDRGRVVANGRPSDVLSQQDVIDAFLG